MRDGFIKVAAGTPKIRVADCRYNAEQIFTLMREADKQGVKVLCLPGAVPHRLHLRGPVFAGHPAARGGGGPSDHRLEATRNLDMVTAAGPAGAEQMGQQAV